MVWALHLVGRDISPAWDQCPVLPNPPRTVSAQIRHLLPGDARCRQDDPLCQPVAALDVGVVLADVEQLDHDLVRGARIVRIDDADAVGDDETALEWRAASGENRQEISGRHFDDETGAHQGNLPRWHHDIVRGGQIKAG